MLEHDIDLTGLCRAYPFADAKFPGCKFYGKFNPQDFVCIIPDAVEEAIEEFSEEIKEVVGDVKETATEIKRRAKAVKEEIKDVVEEVKDVVEQSKDVVAAAKGKKRRGRKPKNKK